jgi:hypothetical protein
MKKLLSALAFAAIPATANAATVYSTDFDGNVVVGPGLTVVGPTNGVLDAASTGAWNANGWAGNYFLNASSGNPATMSVLTISNLPTHTTMSISFLLGFLESWDSRDGSCCAPDNLALFIDGQEVALMTANNALGSVEDYDGGTELFDGPNINFRQHFNTVDTLVDMSTAPALTFAHSASTLTFGIQARGGGWQGGGDEAWGIDKLHVTFNGQFGAGAIPEPATWAMMIVGFGLVGGAMRRRTRLNIATA